MDRIFIISAFCYAIVGMLLGIMMAASQDHAQHVTHAHIMLLGFVVSFVYGLCHKLWLNNNNSGLAKAQLYVHQLAAALMSIGLFILYGQLMKAESIEPVLKISSLLALIGVVLMLTLILKQTDKT